MTYSLNPTQPELSPGLLIKMKPIFSISKVIDDNQFKSLERSVLSSILEFHTIQSNQTELGQTYPNLKMT
jgi:hypothetical protein